MEVRHVLHQFHHPVVVLRRMQPCPREHVLPRLRIAVLRLVHMPQHHQMYPIHSLCILEVFFKTRQQPPPDSAVGAEQACLTGSSERQNKERKQNQRGEATGGASFAPAPGLPLSAAFSLLLSFAVSLLHDFLASSLLLLLTAKGSERIALFPMLHCPFAPCASSIVTLFAKSSATPSWAFLSSPSCSSSPSSSASWNSSCAIPVLGRKSSPCSSASSPGFLSSPSPWQSSSGSFSD